MKVSRQTVAGSLLSAGLLTVLAGLIVSSSYTESALSTSLMRYNFDTAGVIERTQLGTECASDGEPSTRLAQTIMATENSLIGHAEQYLERIAILVGSSGLFPLPDMSLGPAQIRLSHYLADGGTTAGYWTTVGSMCGTLDYVRSWLVKRKFEESKQSDRFAAYSEWSGHASAIGSTHYSDIAYALYADELYYNLRRVH